MKKTWNLGVRKLCAAAVIGMLAVQSAFVPVMADDTESELPVFEDAEVYDDMIGALPQSVTADIEVSGTIPMGESGGTEMSASAQAVFDREAAAHSVNGQVDLSGVTIEFAEYMDLESILFKLPLFPKVIAYNYKSDLTGSFLAQIAGEDNLQLINSALQLVTAQFDPEAMQAYADEITAVLSEIAGSVTFEEAPEKECSVGGEMVACQGMSIPLTKDFVKDALSKLVAVKYPNGQTIEEYFNLCLKVGGQDAEAGAPQTIEEAIDMMLAQLPEDMKLLVYMNPDGSFPAEIGLEMDGHLLALQFAGPAETPWTEIVLAADGEEMGKLTVELTDNGALLTLNMQGEELGTLAVEVGESGFTAVLTVQGQEIGSLYVDVTEGTFEVTSDLLPTPITGTFGATEEGGFLTAEFMGFTISINVSEGGTVVVPEGEVLELNTMTEEEFNELSEGLSSLFGGSASTDAAA